MEHLPFFTTPAESLSRDWKFEPPFANLESCSRIGSTVPIGQEPSEDEEEPVDEDRLMLKLAHILVKLFPIFCITLDKSCAVVPINSSWTSALTCPPICPYTWKLFSWHEDYARRRSQCHPPAVRRFFATVAVAPIK